MDSQRVGYTINPETGKQIKIGGPTWKRLAAKYYRVGDTFTDQTMPDTRAYVSNKIFGKKLATTGSVIRSPIRPCLTREPMCRTRYSG